MARKQLEKGEMVEWDESLASAYPSILRSIERYGKGPFRLARVTPSDVGAVGSDVHKQRVGINISEGRRLDLSGFWFRKVA